jgi:hypothetical protein
VPEVHRVPSGLMARGGLRAIRSHRTSHSRSSPKSIERIESLRSALSFRAFLGNYCAEEHEAACSRAAEKAHLYRPLVVCGKRSRTRNHSESTCQPAVAPDPCLGLPSISGSIRYSSNSSRPSLTTSATMYEL